MKYKNLANGFILYETKTKQMTTSLLKVIAHIINPEHIFAFIKNTY